MSEVYGENEDLRSDAQRRIRRSPLLFTTPLVLLGLLTALLLWEAIRVNVSTETQAEWPWRLQLIDAQVLGSLLAVSLGAVLARAQYARTVRPYLGWRAAWTKGLLTTRAPAWRVGILNGGQHMAVIESWDVRVVMQDADDSDDARWSSVSDTVAGLVEAGFVVGEDFRLIGFGAGFPLMGAVGGHETVLVGAFSESFAQQVQSVYVRVRVTDVVGDTHERTMDCLKGVWTDKVVPPAD
ncbi:hypothetical protein PUR34_13825 [Streptomyces sp. JV185]|uniref:hypothetical protein n=1 Tax=Streptomyces sp. JV185 TaxID=858638 RepID=UPI002E777170|nr:hypothetical protein [Streptomyces sp. JV185]MEE1769202.1 hypothetical protein [Streptomyces sp. JV185]